jgi:predicted ABC-type exoprotein transport system permease subunit
MSTPSETYKLLIYNSLKYSVINGIIAIFLAAVTNGEVAGLLFVLLIGMGLAHFVGALSAAKLIIENYKLDKNNNEEQDD